jgi:hypothetical protein
MFTTEAQRAQRDYFFVCRGDGRQTKSNLLSVMNFRSGTEGLLENRRLPILQKSNPSLCPLCLCGEKFIVL